jgi:hypothetical protein
MSGDALTKRQAFRNELEKVGAVQFGKEEGVAIVHAPLSDVLDAVEKALGN